MELTIPLMLLLAFIADHDNGTTYDYSGVSSIPGIESQVTSSMESYLLNDNVTPYIGSDWSIAWGPHLYFSGTYQGTQQPYDNLTMVLYNSTEDVYVVTVAGANAAGTESAYSFYDWAVEAFDLSTVQALPGYTTPSQAQSSTPMVSAGSATGINNLLGMPYGGSGDSLEEFLTKHASTETTLVFAGHSLGGGLVPLLALSLYETSESKNVWENVFVAPFAGPSFGQASFVSAYQTVFPPTAFKESTTPTQPYTPGQFWNINTVNLIDPIPRAFWYLTSIPTIFTTATDEVEGKILFDVGVFIGDHMLNPTTGERVSYSIIPYGFFCENGKAIPGSCYPSQPSIEETFQFSNEATYQHICPYLLFAGVQDPADYSSTCSTY